MTLTTRCRCRYLCERHGMDAKAEYYSLVRKHHGGFLKPPFNVEGRSMAGMSEEWYLPLTKEAVAAADTPVRGAAAASCSGGAGGAPTADELAAGVATVSVASDAT